MGDEAIEFVGNGVFSRFLAQTVDVFLDGLTLLGILCGSQFVVAC